MKISLSSPINRCGLVEEGVVRRRNQLPMIEISLSSPRVGVSECKSSMIEISRPWSKKFVEPHKNCSLCLGVCGVVVGHMFLVVPGHNNIGITEQFVYP